jgi:hypothetical protein
MTVARLSRSLSTVPFGTAPDVAVDIVAVGSLPGYLQALVSFLLVGLFGAIVLRRSEGFLDRSIDALHERPYSAVPYGLVAYALALAVGLYGFSQLGRVGVAGTVLGVLVALLLSGVIVSLTAFGFLVVGTLLTDIQGQRRPTYGLVIGAALSAVGWLALPMTGGLLVWVVVAAFGLGGAVRRWFHAERTVETERAD